MPRRCPLQLSLLPLRSDSPLFEQRSRMQIRHPIVAGTFYEATAAACRVSLDRCIPKKLEVGELPERIVAGIVPHAGWTFSGPVAGKVFKALAERSRPEVFVLFGAMHRGITQLGGMFAEGAWRTPLGDVRIDERLADRILSGTNLIERDSQVHAEEHSLEVVVPFIQYLFPDAKILPIAVPPVLRAHEIGQAVGRILAAEEARAVCIGSTDLTHYGPSYGFNPQGFGQKGIDWARQINDKAVLELICGLKESRIVPTAMSDRSACGAGAVAATVAAARQMGAEKAIVLEHTSSAEIARDLWGQDSSDSVGYAAVVLG